MRSPSKALEIQEIFQDHSLTVKQLAMWTAKEVREEQENVLI